MARITYLAMQRALSQVGYTEDRNNWTIFSKQMKHAGAPQNAPYCAIGMGWGFDPWVAWERLFDLPWYVPNIWRTAARNGWTTNRPTDGDAVVFDWRSDGSQNHIGFAYPSHGKNVSVEFNTSPTDRGSQSNGGGVYMRTRRSRDIEGYIDMDKVIRGLGISEHSNDRGPRPTMRQGARGDWVRDMQAGLRVTVDGVWGRDTDRALIAFQRSHGLSADGVCGTNTWEALGGSIVAPKPQTILRKKLRRGDRGSAVVELQRLLGGLDVDGVFGAKTDAAVRAFQKRKGLTVDGVVGSDTWSALLNRKVDAR